MCICEYSIISLPETVFLLEEITGMTKVGEIMFDSIARFEGQE